MCIDSSSMLNKKKKYQHLKYFCKLFLPIWIFLSLVFWFFYYLESQHNLKSFETNLTYKLDFQKKSIHLDSHSVISDLIFLREMVSVSNIFQTLNTHEQEIIIEECKVFLKAKEIYDQFRLLDLYGKESIRINYKDGEPHAIPASQLQDKSRRYYFLESLHLNEGEVYVSPFDLNIEHGMIEKPIKPMIRIGTPIYRKKNQKQGIIILNFLGKNLINNLDNNCMLINKEGYWLKGDDPNNEWGFMFSDKKETTFANIFHEEWQEIIQNESGQFYTDNGLFSFTTVFPFNPSKVEATTHIKNKTYVKTLINNNYFWKLVLYIPVKDLGYISRQTLRLFFIIYVIISTLLFVGSIFIVRSIAYRKHTEDVIKALPQKIIQAQEEERKNISREIHDDLGQSLATIKMLLSALCNKRDLAANVRKRLNKKVIECINDLIKKTRRISSGLRPATLEVSGLHTALKTLIDDFQHSKDIEISFVSIEFDNLIFGAEKINLYRIFQEALTNISKHAEASIVDINIEKTNNNLLISIVDNGKGFNLKKEGNSLLIDSFSFSTMKERIELLGGTFSIQSEQGKGTSINLTIPVYESET